MAASTGFPWARTLALALALALWGHAAGAIDLPASDAGFVTSAGGSAKGDGPVARFNYSVGWELHYTDGAPPPPLVAMERRNYFVFDLAGVAPITTAALKLWTGTLESAAASETWVLKAPADQGGARADAMTLLSTPYPGGFDSPGDMAVAVAASLFGKLGAGTGVLATADIGHADDSSFLSISFTPAGVALLNTLRLAHGPVILGGLVSSIDAGAGSPQQPFGFTGPDIPGGDPMTPLLVLGLVPEPAGLLLMAAGLLAGWAWRRWRLAACLARLTALLAALLPWPAAAVTVALASTQVGGFYADGGHDNLAGFQNYFVGYGTSPGSARTAERRSFFVFDLSGLAGPVSAASFSLTMPAFGVIGDEPSEIFVLSASPVPASAVLDPVVAPGVAAGIFGSLGTGALVAPELGIDVGAPPSGLVLTLSLNAVGLAAINAPHPGGLLVLGGRMASWSFDPDPLHEPHELLFGHSDVVFFGTPGVAKPILTLTVVPEPAGWVLLLSGLALLLSRWLAPALRPTCPAWIRPLAASSGRTWAGR